MAANILDGEAVAKEMLAELRSAIDALASKGRPPHLVAIRANDDAGSAWYAKAQAGHCETHGVRYTLEDLGPEATETDIGACIERCNETPEVSAILLHLPLPKGVDHLALARAIDPAKDAEGIHPENLGRLLVTGRADPGPCTAMGAVELVKRVRPALEGARALVMGRSAIVGKPAALLLLNLNASVMIGHSRSDVADLAKDAEVIVAATGAAGVTWERYKKARAAWKRGEGEKPAVPDLAPLIRPEMIRPGAILIDVGVNHIPKGFDEEGEPLKNSKGKTAMRYVGDIDVEGAKDTAGWVTNPRGGTGPVTNAFLLRNTVHAACRAAGWET